MGRRRLQDTVTVVTGASSGIGRATATQLLEAGGTVVAVARREQALQSLAEQFDAEVRERLHLEVADVTDAEALERIARATAGRFGRIDGWVNNAAVNQYGRFEELPLDEWKRVVEVNLFGYVHGARAVLPWFREQGHGVLVNVGSVLSKVPAPLQSAYVCSKYAIRALTETLRQETKDAADIHHVLVMPGPIDTPLFASAANRTGYRITPPEPTVAADRVAAAIVKNLARPRREVPVGVSTRPGLAFMRLVPGLTERVSAKAMADAHLTDEASTPTAGNVFEPLEGDGSVSGGWEPVRSVRPGRALAVVGGIGVAAAAVAGARRRTAA